MNCEKKNPEARNHAPLAHPYSIKTALAWEKILKNRNLELSNTHTHTDRLRLYCFLDRVYLAPSPPTQ